MNVEGTLFHRGPPCGRCLEAGGDLGHYPGVIVTKTGDCFGCNQPLVINGSHGPPQSGDVDIWELDQDLYPSDNPFQANQDFGDKEQFLSARLDDIGNGERLVLLHGRKIHHVNEWGWLAYDGRRWMRDTMGHVQYLAKHTVASMHGAISAGRIDIQSDAGKAWAKHATRSGSSGKVEAMMKMAESEPGIARVIEDFDQDPLVINTGNGVVDLRTGKRRPGHPWDRMTKIAGCKYDHEAEAPRWYQFLDEVTDGNRELMDFLQIAVGYSLTGDTGQQCLFFLFGDGKNGKSTFLETIRKLMGEYAATLPFDAVLRTKHGSAEQGFADLPGRRFVTAVEAGEGRAFDEEAIKTLTGGDRMRGKLLYKDTFEFKAQCKLWLAANDKPAIKGVNEGIWRRFILIPFTVEIPAERCEHDLDKKLEAEMPGILAWAVRGAQRWLDGEWFIPECVEEAKREYRTDQDVLGRFAEEECLMDDTDGIRAGDLLAAYNAWAKDHNEAPMNATRLGTRLVKLPGVTKTRTKAGVTYAGIRLNPDSRYAGN